MTRMEQRAIISDSTKYFKSHEPLPLELGGELPGVKVAYRTWGKLNAEKSNVILVCHALTGNADADSWWCGMFGEGRAFDETKDFIICSNVIGSCYGSTGPLSRNPLTGKHYGPDFPRITIRDIVNVQRLLLRSLGIERIRLVVGASLGGMQVLEWGAMYPEMAGALMPMGISGRHSAWCIAQSEAQRQAIAADAEWQDGWYDPATQPRKGLAAARMMAMCTYRCFENYQQRFGRQQREDGLFEAESYVRHQGDKLVERFDANTYVTLTRAMDMHDLGRGRESYEATLAALTMPVEILSIDSDVLYPKEEQEELARLIPGSRLLFLDEPYGHDAFLIDTDTVSRMVCEFKEKI
ncbi:homoserine O-acetyltransferase [Chlorobaculum sp. MV4-Y]|uniref:homoserine O-acetyltransferase MetX n=1 Tax=Chlorobaculum sp. MV4-Y TaxID=2976335 RepID=UPI0021AE4880|nr:homoserine O-acetyltransferase [Chlorobaculum sp. MV4-Y]UWX57033.1 homoserine O-acetyltransferase [Chlorobaculum sp. MV4-Y]